MATEPTYDVYEIDSVTDFVQRFPFATSDQSGLVGKGIYYAGPCKIMTRIGVDIIVAVWRRPGRSVSVYMHKDGSMLYETNFRGVVDKDYYQDVFFGFRGIVDWPMGQDPRGGDRGN